MNSMMVALIIFYLLPIIMEDGQGQVNDVGDGPQSKWYPSQQAGTKRQSGKLETYAAPDPRKLKNRMPPFPPRPLSISMPSLIGTYNSSNAFCRRWFLPRCRSIVLPVMREVIHVNCGQKGCLWMERSGSRRLQKETNHTDIEHHPGQQAMLRGSLAKEMHTQHLP